MDPLYTTKKGVIKKYLANYIFTTHVYLRPTGHKSRAMIIIHGLLFVG
jgi:hypothetical protein